MPQKTTVSPPARRTRAPRPEADDQAHAALVGDAAVITARRLSQYWVETGSTVAQAAVGTLSRLAARAYRSGGLDRRADEVEAAYEKFRALVADFRTIEANRRPANRTRRGAAQ